MPQVYCSLPSVRILIPVWTQNYTIKFKTANKKHSKYIRTYIFRFQDSHSETFPLHGTTRNAYKAALSYGKATIPAVSLYIKTDIAVR